MKLLIMQFPPLSRHILIFLSWLFNDFLNVQIVLLISQYTRHRWADNIKIDLRVIAWDGMDWIDQAQDGTRGGLL
jgi:hypothetical protein